MRTKALILLLLFIGVITSTQAQTSSKISENRTSLIVNPGLDGTDGWTLVPKEKGDNYSYYNLNGNFGYIEAWNSSPFWSQKLIISIIQ